MNIHVLRKIGIIIRDKSKEANSSYYRVWRGSYCGVNDTNTAAGRYLWNNPTNVNNKWRFASHTLIQFQIIYFKECIQ